MQHRFRVGIAALLLALGLHVASAAGASASNCDARSSEPATVAEIVANPQAYKLRCVAITGVIHGAYVSDTVDAAYVKPRDSGNPSSNGLTLGLDEIRGHVSEKFRHVSILGRVEDCNSLRRIVVDTEGNILMTLGYCHYFNGPFLWVKHLRYRHGPPIERRMGSFAGNDYGDLEPAPEDWPHRVEVEANARRFLVALRSGDRDGLLALHIRETHPEHGEDALLHFLLRSRSSPFASIRAASGTPQEIILVPKSSPPAPDGPESSSASGDDTAIVCFCRERTCTGRWPIARMDADNLPSRPYACTTVHPDFEDPGFETTIGKIGLAEPRAPH